MQGKKKMGLSGKGGILCQVGLGIPGPWIILQSSILKPLAAGSVFFGVQSSFLLSRNKLKLKWISRGEVVKAIKLKY